MKEILTIGSSRIEMIFETDEEKIKRNLTKIYDIINNIASKCENKEIDTNKWFYSAENIEKMKQDSNYRFL